MFRPGNRRPVEGQIGTDRFGQPLVACGICDLPTAKTGTRRCDRCWELETRIHGNIDLARKILADHDKEKIS